MSDEVSPWTSVKTFHPQMTLQVGGLVAGPVGSGRSVDDVLGVLAAGLEGAKFTIKDAGSEGFKARYVNWISIAGGTFNKTSVVVTVQPSADGVDLLVEGHGTGEHLVGPHRAAEGLSTGVRELRGRGFEVTVHPWVVPPERRKGKRR